MARALSISHGIGFTRSNLAGASPVPCRPATTKMAQSQTYWANLEADIQTHLKNAIPIKHPVSVFEPMHHLALAAPRTTAPALCIAACEIVGGDPDQAMTAAIAIHLMHAAAHAHQHLPLSDKLRPTHEPTEHKFGPNIELLTGDGIVPFGMELLSQSITSGQNDPGRVLRVIVEITRAAGPQGLVEGYYKELTVTDDRSSENSDLALIEYVCMKKEGELHGCAAACGAILGGGTEAEIERLRRYGVLAGTVKGMLHGVGRNQAGAFPEFHSRVEKLKALAMGELEDFKGENWKVEVLGWFESELCKN